MLTNPTGVKSRFSGKFLEGAALVLCPLRSIILVLVLLGFIIFFWPQVRPIALASLLLNSFILSLLIIGLLYSGIQFLFLFQEKIWWERYVQGGVNLKDPRFSRGLIESLDHRRSSGITEMVGEVTGQLAQEREFLRYILGVLIFLGLLGTFWGLSHTIEAIAQVITDLPTAGIDIEAFFEALKDSLKKPLQGMGMAFGSSLFGLTSSLVLGFVEMQLRRAHQIFGRMVQRICRSLVRYEPNPPVEVSQAPGGSFVQSFLYHLEGHLEKIQKFLVQSEGNRQETERLIGSLAEQLARLVDQMRVEQSLMMKMAQGQVHLQNSLQVNLERLAEKWEQVDEVSQNHLRHIDLLCEKIWTEISVSRREWLDEMRQELRFLGRTLSSEKMIGG